MELSAEALSALLRALGLSPARALRPLKRGRQALDLIQLQDGRELLLRRIAVEQGHDPLQAELAALRLLRPIEGLPVLRDYQLLPAERLPWRAALSALLPGRSGEQWLREEPARLEPICEALARVLATLEDHVHPHYGSRAVQGRFLPQRSSWSAEWGALGEQHLARARQGGADLGPLGDRLGEALREGLPALQGAGRWSVVHGDLQPSNLLFEEHSGQLKLSGVIDWEASLCGDALVDLAWLPFLPEAARRVMLPLLRPRLEGPARERLRVYSIGLVLRRLALAGSPLPSPDPQHQRALGLAMGIQQARDLLERPWEELLEQGRPGADPALLAPVPPHLPLLVAALEAPAAISPGPQPEQALAASILSEGAHPGWAALARRALPPLAPAALVPGRIPDRARWWWTLSDRLLRASPAELWPRLWLLRRGLSALGAGPDPVSDAVLLGWEADWEGQLSLAERPDPRPAAQVQRALLQLAAAHDLGAASLPSPSLSQAQARLSQALEDLALYGELPGLGPDPAQLLSQPPPEDPPLLALVALRALPPALLPLPPGALLPALLAPPAAFRPPPRRRR